MIRPLALAIAFTLTLSTSVEAANFVWTGDTSNLWNEQSAGQYLNWLGDPLVLPGPGDTVLFGNIIGPSTQFDLGNPNLNGNRTVGDVIIGHNAAGTQVILSNSGFTLTLASGNLTRHPASDNIQEIRSDLELGAAGTWNIGGVGQLNIQASIGQSSLGTTLTKTGDGLLRFEGSDANTYTGLTDVTAGALNLAKADGITSLAGDLSIGGTGVVRLGSDNQIADSATVTVNSVDAEFAINGNTETIGTLENTAGTTSLAGGSLTVTTLNGSGAIVLAGGTLTVGAGDFSGNVNGGSASTLVKNTNGTLNYRTSDGNFSGTVNIENGTLRLDTSSADAFQNATVNINSNGGLNINDNDVNATLGALGGTSNWAIGNNTVTVGGLNTDTTFSGSLIGAAGGVFNKVGTGTLTLGGADNGNNLSGSVNVNDGNLEIASSNALDRATIHINVGTGGTGLSVASGVDATLQNLQIGADGGANNAATVTVDGVGTGLTLGGTGGLTIGHTIDGTGTLYITNSASFTVGDSANSITINPTGEVVMTSGGLFDAKPSKAADQVAGQAAPSFTTSGTVSITDSTLDLSGGEGGVGAGVVGGAGGNGATFMVSGGSVELLGSTTAHFGGGNGGDGGAGGTGGFGGNGGILAISAGDFTLGGDSALSLAGGAGGFSVLGEGNGGDGGLVDLSGGILKLDGGTLDLSGGTGATTGAAGSIALSGGTLRLNAGLITGDSANTPVATTPVLIHQTSINATGGTIDLNADLTLDATDLMLDAATLDGTGATGNLLVNAGLGDAGQHVDLINGATLALTNGATLKLIGGTGATGSSGGNGGVGGSLMLTEGSITMDPTATIDLRGGAFGSSQEDDAGNPGDGGSLTVAGGTADLLGSVNLQGRSGAANTSGHHGSDGGGVNLSGGVTTIGATVNLNGGVGDRNSSLSGDGGDGGAVVLSGDAQLDVLASGLITADGGRAEPSTESNAGNAGSFMQSGASIFNLNAGATLQLQGGESGSLTPPMNGGDVTLSGGTTNIAGSIIMSGKDGSNDGSTAGAGSHGGNVFVSGAEVVLTGDLQLQGGDGGSNGVMGNGGNGGSVDLSAGSLTLDTGSLIDLSPGQPGSGIIGNIGSVNVTGGTLRLNAGLITGDNANAPAATTPVLIHQTSISATGGTIDLNADLTVDVAELTLDSATLDGNGVAGDQLLNAGRGEDGQTVDVTNNAALAVINGGTFRLNGGNGAVGDFVNDGGNGGDGGTLNLDLGHLTLGPNATLNLNGGNGGNNNTVDGGNGGDGGTLLLADGSIAMDPTATVNLRGGKLGTADGLAGVPGKAGSLSIQGGTADLMGLVNLNGRDAAGSNFNLTGGDGGTVTLSGGTMTLGGTIQMDGAKGASSNSSDDSLGGDGGTFALSGDAQLLVQSTGVIDANGGAAEIGEGFAGTAGSFSQSGTSILDLQSGAMINLQGGTPSFTRVGGDGGIATLSGGTATLAGTINAAGHPGLDSNAGSKGGRLDIDGAVATLTGSLLLSGGDGGIEVGPGTGRGGNGGQVNLSAGSLTLDTGSLIDLSPGQPGSGNIGNLGSVNASDGVLQLIAGLITGDNTTSPASVDPITLYEAPLNITGSNTVASAPMSIEGAGARVNLSAGSFTATTLREVAGGDVLFTGGTLTVDTYEGALVQNGGRLFIGNTTGVTTVSEDYTLNAGTLDIQLGGLSQGADYDFLDVAGDVNLAGGSLAVSLLSPFALGPFQVFEIVSIGGTRTGEFSALAEGGLVGNLGGANLHITYQAGDGNDIALFTASGLDGDYNNNGVVDAADYTVWRDNLGAPEGTLLNDPNVGVIGTAQYATWKTNFGAELSPGALAAAQVPEPSTGLALAIVALWLVGWRAGCLAEVQSRP